MPVGLGRPAEARTICAPLPERELMPDLESLRKQLGAIDRDIIGLLARRQEISAQVGRYKHDAGLPTRDFAQEVRVIGRARGQAESAGLPGELAENIVRLLINASLSRQERVRLRARGRGEGHRALVVGGGGKMGRWFCEFLSSQGYAVTVADPGKAPSKLPQVECWQDAPDQFELTVVAAPVAVSARILTEMQQAGHAGLIFDIASIKDPVKDILARMASAGMQVASIHPMFGPDTDLLSGCHVLLMDVGSAEAAKAAAEVFAGTMVEILRVPMDEHDRLIAWVLGVSHAINLAFINALEESGEQAPALARMSSTTFDAQLAVAHAVAEDNPHLYFEIQKLNPHGAEVLGELVGTVEKLSRLVRSGNEAEFVRMMESGRRYLAARK
ncbi:MAG: prephenate dehydrogenase/arogenate dehydrogenase family protein [Gammaproteobacteria bacterium]|nr:prephenate dehydrogenase/arogenate dehydrogenase family protein [Gammaproteobacteria bacterium]